MLLGYHSQLRQQLQPAGPTGCTGTVCRRQRQTNLVVRSQLSSVSHALLWCGMRWLYAAAWPLLPVNVP